MDPCFFVRSDNQAFVRIIGGVIDGFKRLCSTFAAIAMVFWMPVAGCEGWEEQPATDNTAIRDKTARIKR
jgi:hypothetical protein